MIINSGGEKLIFDETEDEFVIDSAYTEASVNIDLTHDEKIEGEFFDDLEEEQKDIEELLNNTGALK